MKFELAPDNRNCPDEVLLDDLRLVASGLGKQSITKEDYNSRGRFSAATMQKRFGSWNGALEKSGLLVSKRVSIPRNELLDELRRIARKLKSSVLTRLQFDELGDFHSVTIERAFGSWRAGLQAAGLEVSEKSYRRASDEELFNNLATVWEGLGKQPRKDDLRRPLSNYSASTYTVRFGSWRKALEAFVETSNDEGTNPTPALESFENTPVLEPLKHRTRREPSWRLRFLVNRRDQFRCCACGRSPATELGVVLHVDHIVPWSKGGETTFDNLQTLCEVCNVGKSDLSMSEDAR